MTVPLASGLFMGGALVLQLSDTAISCTKVCWKCAIIVVVVGLPSGH